MKSETLGKNIFQAEITIISKQGFWIFFKEKEYFLSFENYPWFKNACIEDLMDVKVLHDLHLYWEKLDVDLELESLEEPDKYPLTYK
jgi:hypothetical protein